MVVPVDAGLGKSEAELVHLRPDPREARAERVDRSLVDRIVRQVQLVRAPGLDDETEQLLDRAGSERSFLSLRSRGGRLHGGYCHGARIPISLTCATSLSPRPLTQTSTESSVRQQPRCDASQLTACALSRAGTIPSKRLSSLNPSSAS